jgi:hypothetical protein
MINELGDEIENSLTNVDTGGNQEVGEYIETKIRSFTESPVPGNGYFSRSL